jgi:LSD1 subclass zinc finger protein
MSVIGSALRFFWDDPLMKLHCPSCRNLFLLPPNSDSQAMKCPLCHAHIPIGPRLSTRELLGYVPFSLSVMAASGQFLGLVVMTLFRFDREAGSSVLFGFGIPMVLAGVATYFLWQDKPLQKMLGWASVLFSFANGLSLLLVVSSLVLFPHREISLAEIPREFLIFAFGIMMLVTGIGGVFTLRETE